MVGHCREVVLLLLFIARTCWSREDWLTSFIGFGEGDVRAGEGVVDVGGDGDESGTCYVRKTVQDPEIR